MPFLYEDTDQILQTQSLQTGTISKGALAAATIVIPIVGVVFSGFIFDTLPNADLPRDENLKRTRSTIGSIVVSGFLGAVGFFFLKS